MWSEETQPIMSGDREDEARSRFQQPVIQICRSLKQTRRQRSNSCHWISLFVGGAIEKAVQTTSGKLIQPQKAGATCAPASLCGPVVDYRTTTNFWLFSNPSPVTWTK